MKIGLLSPHYAFNYGAVLQAFALKHFLRTNGYDAVILNRRPAYQCAIPSLRGRLARRIEEKAKQNSFGIFEKKYLQPQTKPIISQDDWSNVSLDTFGAIIVGSDQVWRDDYAFNSFGYNLFLDFLEGYDVKRISYAPSLGKESWQTSPKTEDRVKELLEQFSKISVREYSSINILKEKFGVEAQLVLDPTMLLNASDYRNIFSIPNEAGNYLAAYILDYNKEFSYSLNDIARKLKLSVKCIGVPSPKTKIGKIISRFTPMPPVKQWLMNIANSKMVITNSFHGMVFSIIFRKQFIVFMNSERGAARFKSLLNMFGLQERLVVNNNWEIVVHTEIDYSVLDALIEEWRKKSFLFLNEALKK